MGSTSDGRPIRDYLPLALRSRSNRAAELFFPAIDSPVYLPFAAALFFAHRFFIAMDNAFRPAAVRPTLLTGTELLAGVTLGAAAGTAATGAGAAAAFAAFAALIAAQRLFVAAIIARLPVALSFRFAGAVGSTVAGGFESSSTDGSTAFRPGPGGLPFRFGPCRASIAFVNLFLSRSSRASI